MWTMLLLAALAGQAEPAECPIDKGGFDAAWHKACDAAIAATKDGKVRAQLLFRSAFAANEIEDYAGARGLLEQAVKLDPSFATGWHELSYAYNAMGDYAEGERAANAEMALRSNLAAPYQERAFSRLYLANFTGLYADRDKVVSFEKTRAGPLLGRAEAAMWLGRFDAARADVDAAEKLASDAERGDIAVIRKRLTLWMTPSAKGAAGCVWPEDGAPPQASLIGDCTAAFLVARTPAARAEALTSRSIGWQMAGDQNAATLDRAMAAAIEPGNADMHANLGFAYLNARHSWGAIREFDRALAIKESWAALAGRAMGKYNRDDTGGAFADAKRSFELHPNEIALTVLGDVAHDQGDDKSARQFWMAAYRMGNTGEPMLARLKSIGIEHPEKEPRPADKP